MWLARAIFLLSAACTALAAADFESRHSFEFVAVQDRKFDFTVHTQFRTRSRFGQISQVRFGPLLRLGIAPHIRLAGGYYYRDLHDAGRAWKDTHRVFFGVENPFQIGRLGLDSRASLERYFGAETPPYNRFRHRLRATWEKAVAPYAFVEYYLLASGYQGARYAAGVERALGGEVRLELAYYFDNYRRETDRHSLVTALRFELSRAR